MYFKENSDLALNNLECFWRHEDFGRCTLSITAPLSKENFPSPRDLRQKWMDTEYSYARFEHYCNNTYFGAEAMPFYFVNFGPGVLSACIGGSYGLAPNTIWFDENQVVTDWENPPKLKIETDSDMWRAINERTDKFLGNPNFVTSYADLGGIADILASLRGSETLLYDLYDYPDEVAAMLAQIDDLWQESFDFLNNKISQKQSLYSNWMGIVSSRPWYPIQCDFCAMISPEMFEKFVLPSIYKHTKRVERTIYHLDGVGELPHLDMLLDLPDLDGIQWVPGDGKPNVVDPVWFPIYKKIQQKKKKLVLLGAHHNGLQNLLENIDRTGVYISLGCGAKEDVQHVVKNAEKWCKKIIY